MILLIDNYDSFSYNLYQLVGAEDPDIKVIRNDEMTVGEIAELAPERIIISPGPGRPCDAGICVEAARTLGKNIPLLGVCLGHQSICEAFGAEITYAKRVMHGKSSEAVTDTTVNPLISSPVFIFAFSVPGPAITPCGKAARSMAEHAIAAIVLFIFTINPMDRIDDKEDYHSSSCFNNFYFNIS